MYVDTPYYREILILQSTLLKIAAQDNQESILTTIHIAEKLGSGGFRNYFTDSEKEKIQEAFDYATINENIKLLNIQNDFNKMLNCKKSDFSNFNNINNAQISIDDRIQQIEQIFKDVTKSQITDEEIDDIIRSTDTQIIKIEHKDFSGIKPTKIKELFDEMPIIENGCHKFVHKNIKFKNCTFYNLKLEDKHFQSSISFLACKFIGNTSFKNSIFTDDVSFKCSIFNGTTHFEDTNFLKNANFEQIHTKKGAFLFNQHQLDNAENDNRFQYIWSFRGARFDNKAYFFNRVFPARACLSYITFNDTFYFTDCVIPQKSEVINLHFNPHIKDLEISVRTLRATLERAFCLFTRDELIKWEQKAHELNSKKNINNGHDELLTPREAAALLGYSEASLRTMRSTNPDRIKYAKQGNRVFYYKSSIDEFLRINPIS